MIWVLLIKLFYINLVQNWSQPNVRNIGGGFNWLGTYNIGIRKWYKNHLAFTPMPTANRPERRRRRMWRGAAESACQFLWQLRFMAQSARRHQRRPNSEGFFFACPLVIAKVRKKVDTNWSQLLISHTRAKLTFGSSVSRVRPSIRRVTTRRYFSELRLFKANGPCVAQLGGTLMDSS